LGDRITKESVNIAAEAIGFYIGRALTRSEKRSIIGKPIAVVARYYSLPGSKLDPKMKALPPSKGNKR
jgi:hypothetical protein